MALGRYQFCKTVVEDAGGRSRLKRERRGRSRVGYLERRRVEFRSSLHQEFAGVTLARCDARNAFISPEEIASFGYRLAQSKASRDNT